MRKSRKVKISLSPKNQRKIARIAEERKVDQAIIIEKIRSFFDSLEKLSNYPKLNWEYVQFLLEYKALLRRIPEREREIKRLRESIEEEKRMKREYEEDYEEIRELEKQLKSFLNGDDVQQ